DREPVAGGLQRRPILAVGAEVQSEVEERVRLARSPTDLARQRERFVCLLQRLRDRDMRRDDDRLEDIRAAGDQHRREGGGERLAVAQVAEEGGGPLVALAHRGDVPGDVAHGAKEINCPGDPEAIIGLLEDRQRVLKTLLSLVGAFGIEVPAAELREALTNEERIAECACRCECLLKVAARANVIVTSPQATEIEKRLPCGEPISS